MKRSPVVVLVLSGALFAGCEAGDDSSWEDTQTYTNNTHVAGRGYYHARYRAWYPFPYNYRDPSRGYFHGGNYSTQPHVSQVTASRPATRSSTSTSSVRRGGFSISRSSSGLS